jgi:hypothetical protein
VVWFQVAQVIADVHYGLAKEMRIMQRSQVFIASGLVAMDIYWWGRATFSLNGKIIAGYCDAHGHTMAVLKGSSLIIEVVLI